jgi:ubiquinone/menaquinone biosynthesis C-methylase UbiE
MSPAQYTFGHTAGVLRSHRWRTIANSAQYMAHCLGPTSRVCDVGCGPGSITAEFAEKCAAGRVVGLDAAPAVIEQAAGEFRRHRNLEFVVADMLHLPFDDNTFDVVHCHQTLHHIGDQAAAVAEMRRVCADGGCVCVREADYDTAVWTPRNASLDLLKATLSTLVSANGGDPSAGAKLVDYAADAGFAAADISVSSSSWRFASDAERAWWGGLWAERVQTGPQADQMRASGMQEADISAMVDALRAWAADPAASFATTFGEVVCRVRNA